MSRGPTYAISAATGSRRCGHSARASPNSCLIPRTSQPGSSPGCGATRCASTPPSSTSASAPRSTPPCSRAPRHRPARLAEAPGEIDAAPRAAAAQEPGEREGPIWLPAFLAETCLSYCEFYELWASGFVPFRNGASPKQGEFPAANRAAQMTSGCSSPGISRSRTTRRCSCSSGSGTSCASAATVTRSRSCGTSATCCSCGPVACPTRTSSASSPPFRCCATSSGWTSRIPRSPSRPERSAPTARTCWRCGPGVTRPSGSGRCGS